MRGWLRAVRRELAHDAPLWSFPVVAVVTGILLWSHGSEWGARWNLLGGELREDVIVLGPLLLVVGVWHGGRDHRDGVLELIGSTRRAMLAGRSAAVTALTLASFAGVVVGWASAAWTIPLAGGWGTDAAFWYLAGMAPTVAAYAAGGFALGRVLTWRIAAPVVGAGGYLILGFVVYRSDWAIVVAGMGDLGGSANREFATRAFSWAVIGLAAAAVALTALGSVDRRPAAARWWLALAVAGGVLAVSAAPITTASATAAWRSADRSHEPLVCDNSGGPRVCVYVEDQHWLGLVTTDARRAISRLQGIDGAPTWAGPGAERADVLGGMLETSTSSTTPWGRPDTRWGSDSYVEVASYFDPFSYCAVGRFGGLPGDSEDEVFQGRAGLIQEWALGQRVDDDDRLSRRFWHSSDAQRRAFATAVLAAARSCSLTAAKLADDELAAR